MKKLLVLIAAMFLSSVAFAQYQQTIPKNGQPKLVQMSDGSNVVVVLVTQKMPNGQSQVVPYAFNQTQLNTIITTAQSQEQSTVNQAQSLLALFPTPTPTATPVQ